jgi:hypothetical protein
MGIKPTQQNEEQMKIHEATNPGNAPTDAAERAAWHAQQAEALLAHVKGHKGMTKATLQTVQQAGEASTHASLALFFQREADRP